MDNAAYIRLHYAQQRKGKGQHAQQETTGNAKGGTRPSDARNRLCAAVQKYAKMLPAGETVLMINIPAHAGSKARMAGSASAQEAVAVVTALVELLGNKRKNLVVLLEEIKDKLAEMTPGGVERGSDYGDAADDDDMYDGGDDGADEAEEEARDDGNQQDQQQVQQQPPKQRKHRRQCDGVAGGQLQHVRRRGLIRGDGHVPGMPQEQVGHDLQLESDDSSDEILDDLDAAVNTAAAAIKQAAGSNAQATSAGAQAAGAAAQAAYANQPAEGGFGNDHPTALGTLSADTKARCTAKSGSTCASTIATTAALLRRQLIASTAAAAAQPGSRKDKEPASKPLITASNSERVGADGAGNLAVDAAAAVVAAPVAAAAAVRPTCGDGCCSVVDDGDVKSKVTQQPLAATPSRQLGAMQKRVKQLMKAGQPFKGDAVDQPNNGRNRRKHHTKTHTKVLKPKVGQQEPHADMDEATIAPDSTAPLNSECGAVIECEGVAVGPRRSTRAAAAGVGRVIGQCKGNDLLVELAEAQAEGYDSDDGSLDDEQWREIEHRSRRHPVRGTMKVTRAIDDNDRIAALHKLKAALAALDKAAGSNIISQADIDRASETIVGAECYGESSKKVAAEIMKARSVVNTAKFRLQMAGSLA